jgi:hypothetical protein
LRKYKCISLNVQCNTEDMLLNAVLREIFKFAANTVVDVMYEEMEIVVCKDTHTPTYTVGVRIPYNETLS